jgi:hypothetical protein
LETIGTKRIKAKVVKLETSYCYDCGGHTMLYPASVDWEEFTLEEIAKLKKTIMEANSGLSNTHYVLVTYESETPEEVFLLASQWRDSIEKERIKREKEATKRREITERQKLERKMKQLEKLKKELGEN